MLLSIIGLVVVVSLVVVGTAWVVKNVKFNQTEDKENTK